MIKRLGLWLYSAIFLSGGWSQATEPSRRAELGRRAGLPVTDELVRASGWSMMAAAIALQIRPLRRPAALALAVELVPITFVGHRFWELEPGPQRVAQRTHFLKNISLCGAALYILAAGD